MTNLKLPIATVLLVFGASLGEAQERRRVALTMGAPSGVGLLWHIGDRVALRSDFDFSTTSNEAPNGQETTSWIALGGLSALLPAMRIDSLRAYFVPRFSYMQSGTSTSETTQTYSLDGAFEVQRDLSQRLGVFGQAGLRYSQTTRRGIALTGDEISRGGSSNLSMFGGVGLMLYLR